MGAILSHWGTSTSLVPSAPLSQVAALFEISPAADLAPEDQASVLEALAAAIRDRARAAAALQLLKHWPALQRDECAPPVLVRCLFEQGLSSLAVDWVLEAGDASLQVAPGDNG